MSPDKDALRFGCVFFGSLLSFLLVPMLNTPGGRFFLNVFFALLLFYTLWITRPGRTCLLVGGGLLLWRVVLTVLHEVVFTGVFVKGQYLLVLIAGNVYVACMLLVYVFCRRGNHGGVILAALTSYVLMGFILTDLFLFVEMVHPGSFWVQTPGATGFTWADSAAYSFHLLSPMGPPGVVAVGLCARSMAIVGALLGFCYMAILVSKIVNWAPLLKPKDHKG